MDELVGQNVGRYRIAALVGEGGMATVYQGEDPRLHTIVAVKVMHAHLAANQSFVGRFQREAHLGATLRHPNIARVLDFDTFEGAPYLVMEYIEGPTLETVLTESAQRAEHLPLDDVLRMFAALGSAVDYAHHKGMIHRDIKPANVIFTTDGDPVLTDYGIAQVADGTVYTMPGTVMGSAPYMSPEQAKGLAGDHRSDIYSLGIILFEALAGRVPFEGDTAATILAKHVKAPVPSLRGFNPDLPPPLEAVVLRVLAKDPDARYQSAGELVADLKAAIESGRPPAGEPVPPPPLSATVVAPAEETPAEAGAAPVAETADEALAVIEAEPPAELLVEPALAPITSTPPPRMPAMPTVVEMPAASPADVGEGPEAAPGRVSARSRPRRPWLLAVLALLVLAGVGGGLYALLSRGPSGDGQVTSNTSAAGASTLGTAEPPTATPPPTTMPPAETTATAPGAKAVKIKLATITPQGGSLELEGLNARNAILLAVDEFNAGNPNIEVSLAEGIETPGPDQAAASAAESGSDPMVMGMIGPMTSLAAQAVLRELEPKNLPMISPSATRDDLNRQGFTMFHRVVPYTKMECACAAGIIADDLQAKKVFIVSNPETAEFAEETPQFLVNNHGLASGMIEKAQVPREETEFSGLISAIKAFGTDVCFAPLASPAQCAALAAQMQRLGYKVQLVGVDLGGDKNEFVSGAEGATEGMYVASLGPLLGSSDKPKTVEFVEKFRSKFGEPSAFTGHAYEAAGIMLQAFARAFETGGGQVTRQGVAQALADTRYDGVLNFTVQFDPNGDLTKSGVFVCRVQDGRLVQLKLAAY